MENRIILNTSYFMLYIYICKKKKVGLYTRDIYDIFLAFGAFMNLGTFVKLFEILSVPFFGRRQKPSVIV